MDSRVPKWLRLEDPTQWIQFNFYREDLKSMLQMAVHHAGLYLDGSKQYSELNLT